MDPTAEEIRAALSRVVDSPQFSGSERLRRFLTFVVDRAIDGRAAELKEFVVATAVFDRDQTYDPRLDALVRVEAGRLRSRLAEYYAEGGLADPVAIRIPKGGYAPVFERRSQPASADSSPSADAPGPLPVPEAELVRESTAPSRPPWTAVRATGAAAVALALAAGAFALWDGSTRAPAAVASPSLAVLPFDGDTDGAIAAALSRAVVGIAAVDVIAHGRVRDAMARGSTASQIAEAFQAGYTIEGRVETREETLFFEVVLVDARVARKLWVQSFTGAVTTRDALVREAASAVAKAVAARR